MLFPVRRFPSGVHSLKLSAYNAFGDGPTSEPFSYSHTVRGDKRAPALVPSAAAPCAAGALPPVLPASCECSTALVVHSSSQPAHAPPSSPLQPCGVRIARLSADLQTAQADSSSAQVELETCLEENRWLTGAAEGNATKYQSCTSELASVKFMCGV